MLEGLLLIIGFDLLSIFTTFILTEKKEVNHNSRWFFIHFLVNLHVTIYTYEDLVYCLNNINECTLEHTSPEAYKAINLVIISHIYHLVIFYNHLKNDDIFHHVSMCGFNGYVFYRQNLKIQSVTGYFCSGLPGMIDYFLIYLVKIKLLDPIKEKKAYLFLTTYIRSPGCVLSTLLSIPYFMREQTNFDFYLSLLSISLVFWNGQHYMAKTCIDYGKKIK
jgi:hypothetical protein